MWFFLILIFLFAVDILGITTLPLLFLLLLVVFFSKNKLFVFILAFFSGLVLDILFLRPLGSTSLFFTLFIFVLLLYSRKFEIQNSLFVFLATFFGEILYLALFNYNYIIQQALASSVFALLLFKIGSIFK